jgi:ATP-dependent protease ClpP protease subunit
MKTEIKITNEATLCTIDIEGVIGLPEESQFAGNSHGVATYERFREELSKIKDIKADEVVVNIRSTGGDVNDALLIYESLASLDAKITTRCYGYTASAATIIAQAASEGCREIALSALYLVHLSSSSIEGNSSDLAERIELLEKTDDRIASLYALRSGREKEHFVALMSENGGRGRWLTPDEVVEAGLADAVFGTEEKKKRSIVDMVKGWFSLPEKEGKAELPTDINILHTPQNSQIATTSTLALVEGQRTVTQTATLTKEDPAIDGTLPSPNALAYAEDARSINFRAN